MKTQKIKLNITTHRQKKLKHYKGYLSKIIKQSTKI